MTNEKLTLEKVTDMLLEGKITSTKAECLLKKVKVQPLKPATNQEIIIKDNYLKFVDKEGNEKSYIQFYMGRDSFNKLFVTLQYTESHDEGKGYFRCLFNRLECLVYDNYASYIFLEVDFNNEKAISIYEHLGFYSLGPINTISENIDRIFMRKDLNLFYGK